MKLSEDTKSNLKKIANGFEQIKPPEIPGTFVTGLNPENFDISQLLKYQKIDMDIQRDNILFQIEENQQVQIAKLTEENEQLKHVIDTQKHEIEDNKTMSKKEKHRFWITYTITTILEVIGIVAGILIAVLL